MSKAELQCCLTTDIISIVVSYCVPVCCGDSIVPIDFRSDYRSPVKRELKREPEIVFNADAPGNTYVHVACAHL